MLTVNETKGNLETEEATEESLREERQRTGRYVATVIAIFVSLFGLYQAMARGTPEYAAFFLPALIMFFYVLWILYASRSRGKSNNEPQDEDVEIITENEPKPSTSERVQNFSRSYSIA